MQFLLDSVYFTVFGLKIYMYGVMITLGIIAGIALAFWSFKKRGISTDHIVNLALIAIPCAIIGARIYYCVFFDRTYDFVSFIDITSGGLAVYGAIIGGALAVLAYCLIRKINFLDVADALVPSLAIGQCLGRIGCYFGGCCYGQETDFHVFPFAVQIGDSWRLATFFYESFATFVICVILIVLLRKIKLKGFVFGTYFMLYGIARFFIEGVRGDSLYFLGMRVSQFLSVVLIACSLILMIVLYMYYKRNGAIKPKSSEAINQETGNAINADENTKTSEVIDKKEGE